MLNTPHTPDEATAHAVLTVDLAAIVENWRALSRRAAPGCEVGAAVKANAYGLGAAQVAPALARAGCKTFYVADLGEGAALRAAVGSRPRIIVFSGPLKGTERDFIRHRLVPVLNSLEQVDRWRGFATSAEVLHETVLHVDTGMNRLGFTARDFAALMADGARTAGIFPLFLMTHLACADTPGHEMNIVQRAAFSDAFGQFKARFPDAGGSIANSAALFFGPEFHLDYARPGCALYGVNPTPGVARPLVNAVRLQARILQLREVDRDGAVGYGAARPVPAGALLATVGVGYEDGYFRALTGKAEGVIDGQRVPLAGRVSMDLAVFDVSRVARSALYPGAMIDLIGGGISVDEMAGWAGTIGYEVLTSLGARFHRRYLPDRAA